MERINPHAAGIDCGAAHYVSVPPDRDPQPVRAFKTFTDDLHRLAESVIACGVTTVAMEATGVYWISIYEILEARGLEVVLVNARHVKNVPGRKSDVSDCEWVRELHSVGLLRGSFRPAAAIASLRSYLRHRETLVQSAATHIQRMQKALVQMNLQLHLTPAVVHHGRAEAVLEACHRARVAAYLAHPERFVNGPPQRVSLPPAVWINPPEKTTQQDGSGSTIVAPDDPEVVPACSTYGQFQKLGVTPRGLAAASETTH